MRRQEGKRVDQAKKISTLSPRIRELRKSGQLHEHFRDRKVAKLRMLQEKIGFLKQKDVQNGGRGRLSTMLFKELTIGTGRNDLDHNILSYIPECAGASQAGNIESLAFTNEVEQGHEGC